MVDNERINEKRIFTGGVDVKDEPLSVEQLNNAKYASAHSGSDGYAQIQAAIDAAESEMSNPVAVIDGDGPDDVTANSNADQNRGTDAWLLSDSVTVSDRTTLIGQNCYLFRADNLDKPGIVNEKLNDGTADRNSDIDIIGIGGAWLDGNEEGQTDGIADANRSGIHLHKVDNYEISGWKVSDCGFCIVPEDVTEGSGHGLEIDSIDVAANGDGYHVIGPSEKIEVVGMDIKCGDDALVANATDDGGSGPSQGFGSGGNVENVRFGSVTVDSDKNANVLRAAATDNAPFAARNISVTNVTAVDMLSIIIIGGGDAVTNTDLHHGISAHGVTLEGNVQHIVEVGSAGVTASAEKVQATGINSKSGALARLTRLNGNTVNGMTFGSVNAEVTGPAGVSAIEFDGGTLTDSRFGGLAIRGDDTMDLMQIDANATARNVTVEGTTVNLGQPIVNAGATVEKVRMDVSPRSPPSDYDINETDVYANGIEHHGSIADGGKQALAGGRAAQTTITVLNTTDDTVEQFTLHGGANTVTQHGIDATNFGTTEDNDTTVNVYWDATNSQYELNNEEGASKDFEVIYHPVPVE